MKLFVIAMPSIGDGHGIRNSAHFINYDFAHGQGAAEYPIRQSIFVIEWVSNTLSVFLTKADFFING
jgi:hypothetical protein